MVGASMDSDWSAALWREEEDEGGLFAAAAAAADDNDDNDDDDDDDGDDDDDDDADEMLLLPLLLSCFLPPTTPPPPSSPAKKNWSDRPRTRLGLSGLDSHLANAATSSSRIDGGICLATSSAKTFLLFVFFR